MIDVELVNLSKLAPLSRYIDSGDYCVREIMEKYNKSVYYLVEVLEDLLKHEKIRDLVVTYDRVDKHILNFKFK